VSGLVVTIAYGSLHKLSASIAAPGPHDFAVRGKRFVQAQETPDAARVHRIPIPAYSDGGRRPSSEMRWGGYNSDLQKLEAEYF
jgi:hypothetical protein